MNAKDMVECIGARICFVFAHISYTFAAEHDKYNDESVWSAILVHR